MDGEYGDRPHRAAAARNLEEDPLDRRDGGDTAGERAREVAGHAAAVGDSGRPDARGVHAVPGLDGGQQVADEQPVVNPARVRVGRPAGIPPRRIAAVALPEGLRVGDQEPLQVGRRRQHAGLFHPAPSPPTAMKGEHQRDRAAGLVATRDVQPGTTHSRPLRRARGNRHGQRPRAARPNGRHLSAATGRDGQVEEAAGIREEPASRGKADRASAQGGARTAGLARRSYGTRRRARGQRRRQGEAYGNAHGNGRFPPSPAAGSQRPGPAAAAHGS